MLLNKIESIRHQVADRELKLSDALLLVLRSLRERMPEERLTWLNRELLGYRQDDLEALSDQRMGLNMFLAWISESRRRAPLEVPGYRFLDGVWGRIDRSGRLVSVMEPELSQRQIFCNIGIQQIELQLDEMEHPTEALFSLSFDERTGAEFFCESAELVRVYEHVRAKLLEWLDKVIVELRVA
ncbi:hypothetical protein KF728_02465 [Candidatus Obscuribacterales bacterium]|nr:hypothetical protein [Candidatus Obscuribacterales bacterium]